MGKRNSLTGKELEDKIDQFYAKLMELKYGQRTDAVIGDIKIIAYHDEELSDMFSFHVRTASSDKTLVLDTEDVHADVAYNVVSDLAEFATDVRGLMETDLTKNYIGYVNDKFDKQAGFEKY